MLILKLVTNNIQAIAFYNTCLKMGNTELTPRDTGFPYLLNTATQSQKLLTIDQNTAAPAGVWGVLCPSLERPD